MISAVHRYDKDPSGSDGYGKTGKQDGNRRDGIKGASSYAHFPENV